MRENRPACLVRPRRLLCMTGKRSHFGTKQHPLRSDHEANNSHSSSTLHQARLLTLPAAFHSLPHTRAPTSALCLANIFPGSIPPFQLLACSLIWLSQSCSFALRLSAP